MPIEKFGDGSLIITGDSIRAVASLAALHNWRRNAQWMGMSVKNRPAAGMTVRKFNEVYGIPADLAAKTWADVFRITDDTLKAMRNELER